MSGTPVNLDQRRNRLELVDVLATGDGQDWPDFWTNPEQRRIGEVMYGAQADAILKSTWYADLTAGSDESGEPA